jgi:ribosomal protein S5
MAIFTLPGFGKGQLKDVLDSAGPTEDQTGVVVEYPKPALETFEKAIKEADAKIREIEKRWEAMKDEYQEWDTRRGNARVALIERLKGLGIECKEQVDE